MKSVVLNLLACVFCVNIYAQYPPNDSVNTEAGNTQMIYYQLLTGNKTTVSNTDWHLAVSVRPTQFPNAPLGGTTMRINGGNGVKVYYVPNTNAAGFNTLDTTGWQGWRQLHDSDTSIDDGALNSNRGTGIFDFGWGMYSSVTHNVVGDSLYLFQLPDGSLKKFLVVNLDKDTAYNLRYANIDNSDSQTLHISKKEYVGKQFVYLDMITNTVRDKEPASTQWDLQFLKYAALDVIPGQAYPVVGIWINKGTTAGKAESVPLSTSTFAGTYSGNLNAIGHNWKSYDNVNQIYEVKDSLIYFVTTNASNIYKMIFTGYDNTTGVISFYKQDYNMATGMQQTEASQLLEIYPNPANNELNIISNTLNASVTITDLNGRQMFNTVINSPVMRLNTADMPGGIYLVSVTSGNDKLIRKVVINH